MSVPDNALAPVRQFEIGMPGEERRELRLDRLLDQPFRAAPQNFGQRIVNLIWLTERDNSILVHGVTLLREARVGVAPTPLRRSNHTVITHFPHSSASSSGSRSATSGKRVASSSAMRLCSSRLRAFKIVWRAASRISACLKMYRD